MREKRIRVLFFGESATLAHVARPYLLASSLDADVFEVHFAVDSHFDVVFRNGRIPLHPLGSRSPQAFQNVLHGKGILFDEVLIRAYVKRELELIEELRPDLVVGDLRPSLGVSAPKSGVPYIALTNGYWSPHSGIAGLPPAFSDRAHRRRWVPWLANRTLRNERDDFHRVLPNVFAAQAAGLDVVRREYGLHAFSDYQTGFTWGDRTVFCDTPDLVQYADLPSHHTCIGPVSWSPQAALPPWWDKLPKDQPIIYLSLGSSGPTDLLPLLLDTLSSSTLPIVCSTAGADDLKVKAKNVWMAKYLPGPAVLRQAALAITNGGSPSTYQAFQAGVPVLGLPFNIDQLLCMDHATESGACISVRSDVAMKSRLRTAINRLLKTPSFTERAKYLQVRLGAYDAPTKFAGVLLDMAFPLKKPIAAA